MLREWHGQSCVDGLAQIHNHWTAFVPVGLYMGLYLDMREREDGR